MAAAAQAEKWVNTAPGVEVAPGEFSALHWAVKAQQDVSVEMAARIAADAAAATASAAALASESTERANDVLAEAAARTSALQAEVSDRNAAIAVEAANRDAAISVQADQLNQALAAEATARGAAITTEQNARQTADSSLSTRIDTNTAAIGGNTAAIQTEATTRAQADSSEANARTTLATQLVGGYTGTDLTQVTTGLIAAERNARSTADTGFATQLTMLQAGAGEQFDYATIWYFDSGAEGWAGSSDGVPTWANSFIRPANGSNPWLQSPIKTTGLVPGKEYGQFRIRAQRTGNPVWAGKLWWKPTQPVVFGTGDGSTTSFQLKDSAGKSVAPTQVAGIYRTDWQGRVALSNQPRTNYLNYSNSIGGENWTVQSGTVVTLNAVAGPDGLITATKIDFTGAAGNSGVYHLTYNGNFDNNVKGVWLRGDVGGEVVIIVDPQLTVGSTTCSLTTAWQYFSLAESGVQTTGAAGLWIRKSSGNVIYADAAMVEAGTLIPGAFIPTTGAPVTVTDYTLAPDGSLTLGQVPASGATLDWMGSGVNSDGQSIATLQADYDDAHSVAIDEPTYDVNGFGLVTVNTNWTDIVGQIKLQLTAAQSATDWDQIDWIAIGRPAPGASSAALQTEQSVRATADIAEATARQQLSVKLTGTQDASQVTSGLIYSEQQARVTADNAQLSQINALQASVGGNTTAITTEQTARTTADSALGTRIDSVTATAAGNTAAIATEQSARTAADSALSTRTGTMEARMPAGTDGLATAASVTDEATARASADSSEAAARQALESQVTDPNTGLGSKASVTSLNTTNSDLNALAGTVTAQGQSITAVQAVIPGSASSSNPLATSSALNSLSGTVTQQGGKIDAAQSALSSVQGQINDPDTGLVKVSSRIDSEIATRQSEDQALAQQVAGLSVENNGNAASLVDAIILRASKDGILVDQVNAMDSRLTNAESGAQAAANTVQSYNTRLTAAEGSITSQTTKNDQLTNSINTVDGRVTATNTTLGTLDSKVTQQGTTITSQGTALTSIDGRLVNATNTANGAASAASGLTTRMQAAEGNISSQSTNLTALTNTVNGIDYNTGQAFNATNYAVGQLSGRVSATEGNISAQGQSIQSLTSRIGSAEGNDAVRASAISALETRTGQIEGVNSSQATSITNLTTTQGGHTASITNLQTSLNGVSAKAGITLDVNGRVTGWQLNNNGNSGTMDVVADRFSVTNPDGSKSLSFSDGNLQVSGIVQGSLLKSSAMAMGSTRIACGGDRLAPFMIRDVVCVNAGQSFDSRWVGLNDFIAPDSGNGYNWKRLAAKVMDIFIDVSATCDGPIGSKETVLVSVQVDGGGWQDIVTVTGAADYKTTIPITLRYTSPSNWSGLNFAAHTTQGHTLALAMSVMVLNFNESGNAPGSNSGVSGAATAPPPSGGGGGNYCVDWLTTVLPDGRFVRDLVPGDLVECVDMHTGDRSMQPLLAIDVGEEACWLVATARAQIIQSASTPMDMRDGSVVRTPDLGGLELLTHAHGWQVADVYPVGVRKVCRPDFGNRMFFAGITAERTLATHNMAIKVADPRL